VRHIFGAFRPTARGAIAAPQLGRTTAKWVNFCEQVAIWLPPEADPVDAIFADLRPQNAPGVLPFALPIRAGVHLPADLRRLPEPHRHGLA
jgi:hypothetical protein